MLASAQSFNFSNSMSNSPVTDGANALKLENEIVPKQQQEISSMEQIKDLNEEYK